MKHCNLEHCQACKKMSFTKSKEVRECEQFNRMMVLAFDFCTQEEVQEKTRASEKHDEKLAKLEAQRKEMQEQVTEATQMAKCIIR